MKKNKLYEISKHCEKTTNLEFEIIMKKTL